MRVFVGFLLLVSVSLAWGQTTLVIDPVGVRSQTGGIAVAIFDKAHAKGFPVKGEAAFRTLYHSLSPESGPVNIEIPDVPPGEYAISIYHDEDGNKKLNTNFLGIPNEGMGASNDAPAKFGPPKYQDAAFQVTEGTDKQSLKITMKY